MRKIISLICFLLPILAVADELVVRDSAPDRYVVVKGDTLWDISGKFFKDPWKWPQIWGLNKDTVKDPHWIYPGNVIFLDAASKTLHVGVPVQLSDSKDSKSSDAPLAVADKSNATLVPGITSEESNATEKLSPKIKVLKGDQVAIPTLPASAIGPFLSKPLIVEETELDGAPIIVGTLEKRSLVSNKDIIYVKGMPVDKGDSWQLYRTGIEFIDPDTEESLGYEAVYLGDATVEKLADISTLRISNSILEIRKGDHLIQSAIGLPNNYIPRAPDSQISARVISIYGGVDRGGQNSVVALNKGRRDGVEIGHVLALFHKGEFVSESGNWFTSLFHERERLPDYRYGLIFVFRTFDKVSYGLVVESSLPVQLLDNATTP